MSACREGPCRVSFRWPMKGVCPGEYAGWPFGEYAGGGLLGKTLGGVLPRVDVGYPSGSLSRESVRGLSLVSFREHQQGLRPGADVIALHEIHLARQSSLQVPVGHIPVPGGIKLCSPGTFWVANYLIINNGSFQVNFTKPKRATIRYTNAQWLREDATEASVGRGRRAKVPIEALFATRPCLRTICSRGCRAKPGREPDYNPVNGTDSLSFGTRPCPKSASVEGRRAEDRSEECFATRGCP